MWPVPKFLLLCGSRSRPGLRASSGGSSCKPLPLTRSWFTFWLTGSKKIQKEGDPEESSSSSLQSSVLQQQQLDSLDRAGKRLCRRFKPKSASSLLESRWAPASGSLPAACRTLAAGRLLPAAATGGGKDLVENLRHKEQPTDGLSKRNSLNKSHSYGYRGSLSLNNLPI